MSDYLWDKTGEPDAETERLENLLGQLRFHPTPFDLPAELPARESRNARSPRTAFSWPRLALAASLTLAVLAGAWLMLRQQVPTATDAGAPQLATKDNQTGAEGKQSAGVTTDSTPPATAREPAHESDTAEASQGTAKPATPSRDVDRKQREERAGARPRPRRPYLVRRDPAKQRENLVEVRREETAQAEREAAEKVLYALQVTSEKLNYARQQVQTTARGEDNR